MLRVSRPDRGVRVKICGVTRPQDVSASAAAGVAYIGLNFFPKSPRYVAPDDARELALAAPPELAKVGLLVDPDDAALDAVLATVPLDMVQLHGGETPARVAAIRDRIGLPVMKAVGLRTSDDLPAIDAFAEVADQILVDARPPPGADLPGGNGVGFDHGLIAGREWRGPWMLAGGLTPENVATAVRLTGARQVDLSSGVESAPGVKDPDRIAAFCAALREVA